jgi:hypothetical protein
VSRYDLFRRRIAPIAFLLAIGLIARDSCEKDRRSHTTVEIDLGDARPRVRAVDVAVVVGGPGAEPVARFHRAALTDGGIGPVRFELASPQDDGELQIDLDLGLGAEHRQLTRRFHIVEGATLRVAITEADLVTPATPLR